VAQSHALGTLAVSAVNRSTEFRSDIEGLRAVAVLLVVACHCGISWCSGGFIGVDVFFVLSGYLITGLLVAEIRRTSKVDLPRFYARRARRLLPALLLVLLTTLAAGSVIQVAQELNVAARAARATALYVSNVFFDHNAADYFAPDVASNPFLHTWSLGVEEQFYLFWPVLLILGLRLGESARALAPLLTGVTILSLCFCIWSTFRYPTLAFYELPARAWEFGIGGLLTLASLPKLGRAAWTIVGWSGLSAILLPAFFIEDGSGFPGWLATIPALGTAVVLAAGTALPRRGVCMLLDCRPMQYLGARSYSWYLWHWPFIVFSAAITPAIPVVGRVIVAAGSLGAAALTYQFLERPIRHNPQLAARTALSLGLAAGTAIGAAAIAWLAVPFADRLAHEPAMSPITAAVADIADMPRKQCVSLGRSTEVRTCIFGDPTSSTDVVLFGDSHAIQWFNALQLVARQAHWRLVTVVKSGCAASDIGADTIAEADVCRRWRAKAFQTIATLRPELVFAGSFTAVFGRRDDGWPYRRLDRLTLGTKATLDQLTRAGLSVVLFRDTPLPPFNVPTCLARSALHPWFGLHSCGFDRATAVSSSVFDAEKTAAAGMPRVHFLDLTDQLCRTSVCPAILNNMIVYRDQSHLTGTFASSLAPAVAARLTAMPASSR
jgi:peptidoglycan/LPS O-acetylase OafA/YrhL